MLTCGSLLSILEGSAEKSPGLNPALQTVCWRDLPVLVVLLGDGAHPVPAQHGRVLLTIQTGPLEVRDQVRGVADASSFFMP